MKLTKDNITACLDAIGSEKNPRIALEMFEEFRKQAKEGKLLSDYKDMEYYGMIKDHVMFNAMYIPLLENVSFTDLFSNVRLWKDVYTSSNKVTPKYRTKNGCVVSEFISFTPHNSLYAKPSQMVLDVIGDNMIQVNYDEIYFELIVLNTGKVRLYAKYNQIIGSRLIAILDIDDVRQWLNP